MIILGKTKIQGKPCILIEDYIGSDIFPDSNLIEEYRGQKVFCAAAEILRWRNQTALPIYGIWQVLIASHIVDRLSFDEAHVLYLSYKKDVGQMIRMRQSHLQTESIAHMDQLEVMSAKEITFNQDDLILPAEPIRSISEKVQFNREKRKGAFVATLATLACCTFLFAFSSSYSDKRVEERVEIKRNLHAQQAALEKEQKVKHHLKTKQFGHLAPIIYFMQKGIPVIAKSLVFTAPPYHIVIAQREVPQELFVKHRVTKIKYLSDGSTSVFYQ